MPKKPGDDDEPARKRTSEAGDDFRFADLPPVLRENVRRLGWQEPMPVQARTIPMFLARRDLLVQARTGSGKTGAFGLPLGMRLDPRRAEVQALILTPTRELAEQVKGVLAGLLQGTGLKVAAVYGGVAYGPQIEAFKAGVQVVVATPGRLIDHLESRRASLAGITHLVIDEGDEMLSLGFFPSIIRILSYLPRRRQTALFSATIPRGVANLADRFTRDPEMVNLSADSLHVAEVQHLYYVVDAMEKDRILLRILEMENPEAALIFSNTRREAEYLGRFLQNYGYDAAYLSGDLTQADREKVLGRLRGGKLRFLVATDVAARGIDISDLGYVVLYNLPQAHDHYIHRAGRTGRAGASGVVISLITRLEELELKERSRKHGLPLLRLELPTPDDLDRKVSERLRVMLQERFRTLTNLEKERLRRFLPLARRLAQEEEVPEAVAMLFDRFYHETLNQPLVPPEARDEAPPAAPAPPRRRRR